MDNPMLRIDVKPVDTSEQQPTLFGSQGNSNGGGAISATPTIAKTNFQFSKEDIEKVSCLRITCV